MCVNTYARMITRGRGCRGRTQRKEAEEGRRRRKQRKAAEEAPTPLMPKAYTLSPKPVTPKPYTSAPYKPSDLAPAPETLTWERMQRMAVYALAFRV